jgi:ribosome recycling factor
VTSAGETPEVDDILAEAADKMGKAVAHTQSDFSTIRTGRATPALVEKL